VLSWVVKLALKIDFKVKDKMLEIEIEVMGDSVI